MKKLILTSLLFISVYSNAQTNNYSLDFDGSNDYISIQNNYNGYYSSFSFSGWMNLTASNGKVFDIGCDVGTNLARLGIQVESNQIDFWVKYNEGEPWGVNDIFLQNVDYTGYFNSWTYVSGTWNGDESKLYFNGVLADSLVGTNIDSLLLSVDHVFNIGKRYTGVDYIEGLINSFSIWNIALSQQEIQDYMNCPPIGTESGLVGYWAFEEGTGTTTLDQTTNNNDGTMNGGVTWSNDVPIYTSNCCTANPITTQPTDQTVTIGNDATFSFNDTLTGATYQWQMDAGTGYSTLSNAGQFSGADTKTLTIASTTMSNNNTLYRCIVTESTSCMDTTNVSNLTVIDNTSIGELNNSLVKLFPNPSNGIISLTLAHHSNGQIILTDILGKEVLSKSFTSNEVQLNLKGLESKGTYFAKVLDSNGNIIAIKKLIYQ